MTVRARLALAALLIVPAAAPADDAKKPAGRQEPQRFEKEITVKIKLDYLLYLPDGYAKAEKPWPLIVFLHGAGETGSDVKLVAKNGPPKLIAGGKDFPFVVASPQAPRFGWDVQTLNALLDDLLAKYKVDKDRVYLTGLSMGGFGTWAWAAAHPDRFAAIAPICGGGTPADAKKIKALPVWAFHGAKDQVVPLARSESMVKALKDAGAENVKLTVYPDAAHDSWTPAYDDPALYEWFLKHKRPGAKKD